MGFSKNAVDILRSIEQVEVRPAGFSIITGQNNHGKTNLFGYIEWFYNAKSPPPELHHEMEESAIAVKTRSNSVLDADAKESPRQCE